MSLGSMTLRTRELRRSGPRRATVSTSEKPPPPPPPVDHPRPRQCNEPHPPLPPSPPGFRQKPRQPDQEDQGQHPAQCHVDAERPARAIATIEEPIEWPYGRGGRRARHDLNETDRPEDSTEDAEQGEEPLDPVDAAEHVDRDEEREGGEQPLGGKQALPGNIRRQRGPESRQEEHRDRSPQGPGLFPTHGRIAEPPEPQRGEDGQRALGERDRRREANHEDREDAPAQRGCVKAPRGSEQGKRSGLEYHLGRIV